MMVALFDCSNDNIGLHLKNIFKTIELDENTVAEKSSATASDGKSHKIKHYYLDAFIWHQATVLIHTEPQRAIAKSFAESEFEKYRIVQGKLFESDFDKAIKKLVAPKKKND